MKFITLYVGLLNLCCVGIAAAAPYKVISLDEAVSLALRFNPQIEIAGLTRVTQKFGLDVVKNQYEWQYALNASSQYTWNKSDSYATAGQSHNIQPAANINLSSGANVAVMMNNAITNPNGANNQSTYSPGLNVSLTQPLMRGFGPAIALSPLADALDQEKINQLNLQQTVISTIVKVAEDYENVLLAKQNIQIQQMTVNDVVQRIHDNQIKIHAGIMPPSDNIQAEADLASAQLGLNSAQYSYTQNRLTFLNDLGVDPNEPIDVDTKMNNTVYSLPPLASVKSQVLANDVTYQTLLINHHINQRGLAKASDDQRVQLNLVANGTTGNGTKASSFMDGSNEGASLGLTLSVPIDNLPLKQELLNAKVQLSEDAINIRSQQWLLESSAINALNNLASLEKQLRFAKSSVEQQQQTLAIANKKMHFGMGSALDISTQQKNLTQAQLTYSSSQINYLNTWLQFRQLTGLTLHDFGVTIRY